MHRHVHDAVVGVEHVLRAVAVVRVVVDDENTITAVGKRGRSDRDVVEQAEPHRTRSRRVMAWWSDRAERRVGIARHECIDCGQTCSGREQRDVVRRVVQPGVRIDVTAAGCAQRRDQIDMGAAVHSFDVGSRRGARRDGNELVAESGTRRAFEHGVEARRSLGVMRAREVVVIAGIGHQQHGHDTQM